MATGMDNNYCMDEQYIGTRRPALQRPFRPPCPGPGFRVASCAPCPFLSRSRLPFFRVPSVPRHVL
jgi:hypothetical protein